MSSPEGGAFSNNLENIEAYHDPTALREVLEMLSEIRADEESVLAVIEEVLAEPIPDLSDPEAIAVFQEKMKAVRTAAEVQLARSDLLKDISARIENKINSVTEKHT